MQWKFHFIVQELIYSKRVIMLTYVLLKIDFKIDSQILSLHKGKYTPNVDN